MALDLLHTIAVTILTLGILVTIHEWGHFYIARLCGVKVLRFSVGFGKALCSWKDRKGTEYAIAAIPLGGYVKMLDEREADVPVEQLDVSGVSTVAPIVGSVASGSVAAEARLPEGFEILAVDGEQTLTWDEVNLRLAGRVGESGELTLLLKEIDSSLAKDYVVFLQNWHVDVDKESPVSALGLVPWRPAA